MAIIETGVSRIIPVEFATWNSSARWILLYAGILFASRPPQSLLKHSLSLKNAVFVSDRTTDCNSLSYKSSASRIFANSFGHCHRHRNGAKRHYRKCRPARCELVEILSGSGEPLSRLRGQSQHSHALPGAGRCVVALAIPLQPA